MNKILAGISLALSVALAATAFAGEPVHREIPYSKRVPLYSPRTYTFHFSIYDAATDGTELWYEEKSVRLKSKTLSHNLGSVIAFADADTGPLGFTEQYWIQVSYWHRNALKVLGTRSKLTAAPYALWGVNPGPVGEQGPKGDKGDKGDQGVQGVAGPVGPKGVLGFYIMQAGNPQVGPSSEPFQTSYAVGCNQDDMVTGGGFDIGWRGDDSVEVRYSRPAFINGRHAWEILIEDFGGKSSSYPVSVYVICADMTP